ncbi:MAG: beta/gamma crystallin family protein [Alphaproteobacteria bacterium]|nr:beta/gamma crystallin family protein [Alphaproteobacteria bacterium]
MANLKFVLIAATALAAGLTGGAFAAQQPVTPSTVTSIKVFDQPNFKGNMLMFDRSIASLAALNFNDRTASVKIDGSRDWVLCEHRNFMGKCVRVHLKEKDLKRLKFEGKVSSLYPVPAPPPAAVKPR